MTESLKTFTAGEKITAVDTNNNNRYLENQISSSAAELQVYINQEIASAKSEVINNINPDYIQLASSGTINLTTNSVNYINPTGAVTFVLPSVSADTKLNQILVQVNLTAVYSINVGTEHYFNGKTPNMSTIGMYDLIFEYDEAQDVWVCGWMRKS